MNTLDLLHPPLHLLIFAGVIGVLALAFILFFLLPGLWFRFKLWRLLRRLQKLQISNDKDPSPLFAKDKTLAHLWTQYRQTLHEQKETNSRTGVQEVVALRSTVPAEAFFNVPVLIETRLGTEFFKHLPGIFTGIGIIGTFYGLILGLQAFQVSEQPEVVRQSLNTLLQGVWGAFLVSAFAIAAAMVVTLLEKLLFASLTSAVDRLAQLIDSLYKTGAEEEYLARLVKASEDSASETKILKDALVKDLTEVLTTLANRQIAAVEAGNVQLGNQIVAGFEEGLHAPLDKIASAVTQVSQDQGSAVTKLLTDVLAGFSQRLQELFGSQVSGINQMQEQTIQALQAAVVKLEQMAASVESAGRDTTDAMAAKLTEAITALETRQQVMNNQMAAFVEQIRSLVSESQSETSHKLQVILSELGEKVAGMVSALEAQATQSATSHMEREARVAEKTEQTIAQLGGQAEVAFGEMAKATSEMHASVEAMRGITSDALNKMNSGAETLYVAASDFAKAGQGVSGVLSQATNVSGQLAQAAGAIAGATRSLDGVLSDYKAARDVLSQLIESLQATVENARRDASLTSDILQRLEGAAARLATAQQEADHYLGKVSEVLAESHQTFANSMKRTVEEANTQFYQSLSKATGLLREGIQELEAALSTASAPTRRQAG